MREMPGSTSFRAFFVLFFTGAVTFGIRGSNHTWPGELPRAKELSYAQGPSYRVVELSAASLAMYSLWKYNVFGELPTAAD